MFIRLAYVVVWFVVDLEVGWDSMVWTRFPPAHLAFQP